MSTPYGRELLERFADESAAFWAAAEAEPPRTPEEDLAEERHIRLENWREFNPRATLGEELLVRLVGEAPGNGPVQFNLGRAVLGLFWGTGAGYAFNQIELTLGGPPEPDPLLHLRLIETSADAGAASAEREMQGLLDLVEAIEQRADVGRWPTHLAGMDEVVLALEPVAGDVDFLWYAAEGDVRRARLTAAGRRYYRQVRQAPATVPRAG